jgi:hypothetical protein
MQSFEHALEAVGTLADDLRRRMYLFIRDRGRPVSRDEAAEAVGISRKLAAFHLDKLIEKGLLKAHYRRLSGRSGPGAGRPSKVYEPAEVQVAVSIPSRSYDFSEASSSRRWSKHRRNRAPRFAGRHGTKVNRSVSKFGGKDGCARRLRKSCSPSRERFYMSAATSPTSTRTASCGRETAPSTRSRSNRSRSSAVSTTRSSPA